MNGMRRGKLCLFSVVVTVMEENRLLLAHAHHVSKLFTGVNFFSTKSCTPAAADDWNTQQREIKLNFDKQSDGDKGYGITRKLCCTFKEHNHLICGLSSHMVTYSGL